MIYTCRADVSCTSTLQETAPRFVMVVLEKNDGWDGTGLNTNWRRLDSTRIGKSTMCNNTTPRAGGGDRAELNGGDALCRMTRQLNRRVS